MSSLSVLCHFVAILLQNLRLESSSDKLLHSWVLNSLGMSIFIAGGEDLQFFVATVATGGYCHVKNEC